jgi:hypothetical protein
MTTGIGLRRHGQDHLIQQCILGGSACRLQNEISPVFPARLCCTINQVAHVSLDANVERLAFRFSRGVHVGGSL